jgi:hypothetical protein
MVNGHPWLDGGWLRARRPTGLWAALAGPRAAHQNIAIFFDCAIILGIEQ